jgi:hypothetical protein
MWSLIRKTNGMLFRVRGWVSNEILQKLKNVVSCLSFFSWDISQLITLPFCTMCAFYYSVDFDLNFMLSVCCVRPQLYFQDNYTQRPHDAVSTSETSVIFYETIRRYIPESCHLQTINSFCRSQVHSKNSRPHKSWAKVRSVTWRCASLQRGAPSLLLITPGSPSTYRLSSAASSILRQISVFIFPASFGCCAALYSTPMWFSNESVH